MSGDALYDLLEGEVIPEFYTRDESGIPTAWVKRMRESMAPPNGLVEDRDSALRH
jgi:starch phosphorylase